MNTNLPECEQLKGKYETCFSEWKASKVADVQLGGLHVCTDVFNDYRDCVTLGMKHRLAKLKEERQQRGPR
jgi:hypothetical protein